MSVNYIYDSVQSKIKKSRTRNPFTIAEDNGIMLIFDSNLNKMKGMYTIIKRTRIIILNDLREFMLYDMKSRPEYEANMYAADLLLDDEELMELAKDGYDMQQVAGILNTDINLIGLKMASMNYRGFDLRIGIEPKSDFLRS